MRKGTPVLSSFGKAMELLQLIIRDGGRHKLMHLAQDLDIPNATLYRLLATLMDQGLLQPSRKGYFVAGPKMLSLNPFLQPSRIAAELARESLIKLASTTRAIVHMGTFEDDMVTYLVKVGAGNDGLFTREGMQLEAYCTGIGKVLLADLPTEQRERYLANGPFVALTANTTVDVTTLRGELVRVKERGFAVDNREISADLYCLAVPIPVRDTALSLGISVSRLGSEPYDAAHDEALITAMHETAYQIAVMLDHKIARSLMT
jgi:IclR family transcriptional regulator, acetate operon repressor